MRINATGSNCNVRCQNNTVNPSFRKLIKDKSALPIINNMSQKDILEFHQSEERLSKTKFWDLKISSVGNKFKEFKYHFINKANNHDIITDGIFPYNKRDNTINIYSIIYGPENLQVNSVETLKFKTKRRADELYNTYVEDILYLRNRGYNITPIESLEMKEHELNMLEESLTNLEESHNVVRLDTEIHFKHFTGNDFTYNK